MTITAAGALRNTRVLVLAPDFPPSHGGIQVLTWQLVSHWEGFETLVLARGLSEADRNEKGAPFRVRRIGSERILGRRVALAWLNIRAVAEAVRFRPDVVLSTHIIMAPAAASIHRLIRVPYVQYLHGKEVADRRALAHFAVRQASAVVAVSQYTWSLVSNGMRPGKVRLIPPGVESVGPGLKAPRREPLIVTVSRLADRYKGHDVMLRALPLVRGRVPDARWAVIGDGPLRPMYERTASILGLSAVVDFVGAVDDSERDRWLERAQVFAMPSRVSSNGGGEGFGIVYLEASSHGLPVVAGNVAGAVDAVVDRVTGRLVDPNDHVAVAEAISDLLLNPEQARKLGEAGANRARRFSWPMVASSVQKLLEEVVLTRAA